MKAHGLEKNEKKISSTVFVLFKLWNLHMNWKNWWLHVLPKPHEVPLQWPLRIDMAYQHLLG